MYGFSIRARLLISSAFWTVGLVTATNFLFFSVVTHRVPGPALHIVLMTMAAIGLLIAAVMQVRSILKLFRKLQALLASVRAGTTERIEGRYPKEIEPLVTELNGLLDHRALVVRRAISKAGDLAHGLKTPLALLSQEADHLAAGGNQDAALVVRQQVEQMRRQMDYHLAHARAAASGATLGASTQVLGSVEGLVRTVSRLYADKGVSIQIAVSADHRVRVQSEDLDEMLGNLLDNACKWSTHIAVTSTELGDRIVVAVDDDGPGIAPEMRAQVLQRGVRADEAAPGSGLGLAIVRDLAGLHGGAIALERSAAGGVSARLTLPASTPTQS